MLTDEKKAMMLASFDVFRRPTPKMYRIQKSHDLAVHYWGLGVPLTHNLSHIHISEPTRH